MTKLPTWAEEVRQAFRAGSSSQFLLYGSVFDLVRAPAREANDDAPDEDAAPDRDAPDRDAPARYVPARYVPLRRFLADVMLQPFDVVVGYDRGRGIRIERGGEHFQRFLEAFDTFRGTNWSGAKRKKGDPLALANLLPRDPHRALELLDRFLRGSQHRTEVGEDGERRPAPLKVAIILDYAHFVAPQGNPIHLAGDIAQSLIRLLDWGSDPELTHAFVASFLITENLANLNRLLVESPYSAKIEIALPNAEEIADYVQHLTVDIEDWSTLSGVSPGALAAKLVGLSRVNVRSLILRARERGKPITGRYLTRVKKELIEKEAAGRITFIESKRTLDDVAGHQEAKAWLRQDAELLKRGRTKAIPMGYLLAGRIGTGKTFLVECWAGEVGIPVVALKNFRERWVGATEGNLERIFTILRALGQVVVFIDEADQITGKRDSGSGDSGLSGRIYGMLAAQMSDTNYRGKILWVFATSRPDLVEVDLKRQGRLDVHIPLFPPGDPESRHELFSAMARKVGLDIAPADLPQLPDDHHIGGNEMEGILVRALRLHETQDAGGDGDEEDRKDLATVIAEVIADVRPSAHVERLELMDLLAVKECTDTRFLPERFRDVPLSDVNRRIEVLKLRVGD